jgi:hypothetical protein
MAVTLHNGHNLAFAWLKASAPPSFAGTGPTRLFRVSTIRAFYAPNKK